MVVKLNILLSTWDVVYEHWLEAWQCEVVRVVQSYQGLEGLQSFSVRLFRQVLQTGPGYDAQVANYACWRHSAGIATEAFCSTRRSVMLFL